MTFRRLAAFLLLLPACALYSDDSAPEPVPEPEPPVGSVVGTQPTPGAADPGDPPAAAELLTVCPDSPYPTIQQALDAAPPRATVQVCPGLYRERLVIRRGVTLIAITDAAGTHISADGGGSVITVESINDAVAIEGFTIEHGAAEHGGGVYCLGSLLRVSASTLTANTAEGSGGGLYADGCIVDIEDVDVIANRAGDMGGGAFFDSSGGIVRASHFVDNDAADSGGGAAVLSAVRVTDSRFENNRAPNGGGVITWEGATFEFNELLDNTAERGGGLQTSRLVRFANNVIAGNHATEGGGVYVLDGGPQFFHDVVRDNTALGSGGGMFLLNGDAFLHHTLVERNHATLDGGGLHLAGSRARLVDTRVSGNVADRNGGGLSLAESRAEIAESTIFGNAAERGGGIYHVSSDPDGLELSSTRITGNQASLDGGGVYAHGSRRLWMWGVYLEHNVATARGGGLFTRMTHTVMLNGRLVDNQASSGGGIFAAARNSDGAGAAAYPITLNFLVFHANDATEGGAILVEAPLLDVRSSIFLDNTGDAQVVARQAPPAAGGAVPPYPTVAWTYNDTFPASFIGLVDPTGSNGNLAAPPQFRTPVTGDYHLDAGSPCIDTGPPVFHDLDGTRSDMGMWGSSNIVGLP